MKILFIPALILSMTSCDRTASLGRAPEGSGSVQPSSKSVLTPQAEQLIEISKTFAPNTQSPDGAVKSWWQLKDLLSKAQERVCSAKDKSAAEEQGLIVRLTSAISQNEMQRSFARKLECKRDVFRREIQEVKQESETRSIVFARIWNVSPIPNGAQPDKYDLQYRDDGFKYKYLVEKVDGRWKVSQVYSFKTYEDDPEKAWDSEYKVSDLPTYPAFVTQQ